MKSILILKATKDICGNEVGLMNHHCKLLGMDVVTEKITSEENLSETISKYASEGKTFDYLYLCTHGDKNGFDVNMGDHDLEITWSRFGQLMCESQILNEDTILLLACCKGGLFQVASDILAVCNKINFVCGVKWNVKPWDLTTGFVVFIHNVEIKEAEPNKAAERASLATDYTFKCYDRDEIEISPTYEQRRLNLFYELGWMDREGQIITADEKVLENTGLIDNLLKSEKLN